jgi:hypothetical protein
VQFLDDGSYHGIHPHQRGLLHLKIHLELAHRKQCRLLKLPSIQESRGIATRKYTGFFTQL